MVPGAEILNQDVDLLHQRAQDFLTFRTFGINTQAFFAPVLLDKVGAPDHP